MFLEEVVNSHLHMVHNRPWLRSVAAKSLVEKGPHGQATAKDIEPLQYSDIHIFAQADIMDKKKRTQSQQFERPAERSCFSSFANSGATSLHSAKHSSSFLWNDVWADINR